MTYWNSAALYGGWTMPDGLATVRTIEDLVTVGKTIADRDWERFQRWLPLSFRRTSTDPSIRNLIYQAVGLKYVLDSLAVSAYTATSPKDAEQFKLTALAYKDAYAPFMRTSLYKGINRYYSGQPPTDKKAFKEQMADLANPRTIYSRQNLQGYLRSAIGSPVIGRVGKTTYRVYPKIDATGRDRLIALQERGKPLIGQIPQIPEIFDTYLEGRSKVLAAAKEAYRNRTRDYSKTLRRITSMQAENWIPKVREKRAVETMGDEGELPRVVIATPPSYPATDSPIEPND